jgi:hypothetical protein
VPYPEDAGWIPLSAFPEPGNSLFSAWKTAGAGGSAFRLRYRHRGRQAEFTLDPAGRTIWVTCSPGVTAEEIASVLLGQVLGCALHLRGLTCLHASALALDGSAILLLGRRGAGKSTTAAALRQQGCDVLADDLAVLTACGRGFLVQPGLPHLRLRGDAATHLMGDARLLPPVWTGEDVPDKRRLEVPQGPPGARPLAAVYVLQPRARPLPAPSVRPLHGADGLMHLPEHVYAGLFLDGPAWARELAVLGRLAATVPLRRVERPDGLDALPRTCRAILEDAAAVLRTPA